MSPREVFAAVNRIAHELVERQYRLLNEKILPELDKAGVRFLRRIDLNEAQPRPTAWWPLMTRTPSDSAIGPQRTCSGCRAATWSAGRSAMRLHLRGRIIVRGRTGPCRFRHFSVWPCRADV